MKYSYLLFAINLFGLLDSGVPVCSLEGGQSGLYVAMKENEPRGTLVKKLPIKGRADTSEKGPPPDIKLRLVSGTEWFSLIPNKKELRTAKLIDRDSGTTRLTAVVECESLMEDFNVNFTIGVNIQDVNDNAPIFEKSDYYVSVMEELPIGTTVFTGIRATDSDQKGPRSQISYSVLPTNKYSDLLFIPDAGKGGLVVHKRIDFEAVQNFSIVVKAEDNWSPSLNSTARVHIQVKDADDLNPKFEMDSYTSMVTPNMPLNAKLNILPRLPKAVDQDTLKADVVYRISGSHADRFRINPKTAEITLSGSLDTEENYLITLHAHQATRMEREGQATLRIIMSGTGSGKPRFSHRLYSADVLENAKVGTRILQVSAVDSDKSSKLLYSIRNAQQFPSFSMDVQSGVLSVAAPLDHEVQPSYLMTVETTNGVEHTEAEIEVSIVDVNDNQPEFSQPVYTFLPTEGSGLVGAVRATDLDGDEITYHLLNFNRLFRIEPDGIIRVRNGRYLSNMTYELAVMAQDNGWPSLKGHAVVRVDYSNVTKPLKFMIAGGMMGKDGAMILIIGLAALSLLLLILCLVLLIYLCQRKKEKKSGWQKNQGPRINSLLTTTNMPDISLPIGPYAGAGCMRTDSAHIQSRPLSRSNGVLMSAYNDAVYPGGDEVPALMDHSPRETLPAVYGASDSPHGSQSPLHQESNSSHSSAGGYVTNKDMADRRISVSYRSGALTSEQLRMNSDLLVTDAVHPHMVNHHHQSNGSLDVVSDGMHGPNGRGTLSERPPLTVYF